MKVKLFTSLAQSDGLAYAAGEVAELDNDFAQRLVDSGQAEKVAVTKKKVSKKKVIKNDAV